MSVSYDAIVVGAGIVGAACAREVSLRGLKTLIVDADIPGGGATAAGMGHIVAMDDSAAQLALTSYSQRLWHEIAGELPEDAEFDRCGTLWIAGDEEEMGEVRRKQNVYASAGIGSEVLSATMLAREEPHLRPLAGALLVPGDGVLYPPCAATYLMREAIRMGAQLQTGKRVISARAGCVRLEDGTEMRAASIVNACGADAARITPGLPIRKRRGHLVITDRYPGFVRHQLVELGYLKSAHAVALDSVAFNVQPRRTGQLLIGSSREFGAQDTQLNRALLGAMITRARAYLPEIGELQAIRVWTGFRAATPDKLPLIGPWPEDETLYLATGHEGLGITTSLATARLLADAILGVQAEIDATPYRPSRYVRSSGENDHGAQLSARAGPHA